MRGRHWRATAWMSLLICGLAAGCASGPGGSVSLFPAGHDLLPEAEEFRRYAPMPAPVPRELQKITISPYVVEPGDVIVVEPLDFDSPLRLPVDQTVMVDGTIDLGRYGRFVVAGRTIEEVEEIVQAAIDAVEPETAPINVRLVSAQGALFYVVGEVNAPGAYPLIGRETVLDALMTAGGLTDRADHCGIVLARPSLPEGCRTVLPVCFDQIVQLGDTATNYQIMPGDRIFVASRSCCDGLVPDCLKEPCCVCLRMQCSCGPGVAVLPPPVTYTQPELPMVIDAPAGDLVPPPAPRLP